MRHAQPWTIPLDIRLMNLVSRLLLGVTVIAVIACGVMWLIKQPRFDLRVIRVHGEELEHNNSSTLRMAVASRIRGNFFTVDLEEVRQAFEAAPWVRKATVQRMWPYGLSVTLQEYQAIALWGHDRQTSHLLDVYGDVFEANAADVEDEKLPLLNGPDQEGAGQTMWQLYQELIPLAMMFDQRISELRWSEQGTWSMQLSNGAEIVMGRGTQDEIVKRVRDFAQTVSVALKPYGDRQLLMADLRHLDGYAIQVAGVETVTAETANTASGRR